MGRKMTLCREVADGWGPVAATAGEAGRRVGVSSALGWLAGPGAAARSGQVCLRLRGLAGQAGPVEAGWATTAPSSFLSLLFPLLRFIFS